MKNFTYFRPKNAAEAVGLLDGVRGKSEVLAGGTDLLDLQKEYVAQPEKVISLSDLGEGFTKIDVTFPPGSFPPVFTIGAGVKLAALAAHKDLQTHVPALTSAAAIIGGPQIRNMGTLGGNLCQRNRCWYFRDEHTNCLLKGGDTCFALNGENRYHAVFTKGHKCVIVHPSTLAPALIALGATAEILGPKGKRTVELAKFFRAPVSPNDREHLLEPNEIVLSVSLTSGIREQFKEGRKNASYEVRQKQSHDWPLVQAAVAFQYEDNKATNVRVVLGHVAPTPLLVEAAAKAIEGQEITEETAAKAGEAAANGATPLKQTGYKVKLIAVAVKRALLTAAGGKKYWEV